MDVSGDSHGRILVVDDNPTNCFILEELLEDFEVEVAEDGEEALEKVRSFRPNLVILDIMMPKMDGYEVCQRVRADADLKATIIIFVSAKALLEERIKGLEFGADEYISKPFDHDRQYVVRMGSERVVPPPGLFRSVLDFGDAVARRACRRQYSLRAS